MGTITSCYASDTGSFSCISSAVITEQKLKLTTVPQGILSVVNCA